MQKRTLIVLFLSIGAIGVSFALVYLLFGTATEQEMLELPPDAATPAIETRASSKSRPDPALAPERGIWPGLGSMGFSDDAVHDPGAGSRNERGLDHFLDGSLDAGADEVSVLLDRIERFDRLPLERRAAEAYAIAGAWSRCKLYYPADDAALFELATRRYENTLRRAEAALAESEDLAAVESDIRRIAEIDRQAAIRSIYEALKGLERECAGTVSLGFEEREARVFRWVARAAELGHHAARVDYVYLAFQGLRVTSGKASLLIERKRRVARYVLEMLAKRNVRGLELLGVIAERGYFEPPDAELAYGYTKAAVEIIKRNRLTVWQVSNGDDRNLAFMNGRLAQVGEQLDPTALGRAEYLVRQIVEIRD